MNGTYSILRFMVVCLATCMASFFWGQSAIGRFEHEKALQLQRVSELEDIEDSTESITSHSEQVPANRTAASLPPLQEEFDATQDNKASASNYGKLHFPTNPSDLRPRNLRLAILGDSVSRYQYVSLVYYLRHNHWIQDEDERHLLFKNFYEDWNAYLNASTIALAPNEVCDCHGPAKMPKLFRYVENRYFSHPELGNYVSFFNKYGRISIKGFRTHDDIYNERSGMDDRSQSNDKWAWEYDWKGVILHHIAKLDPKPDFLIVNAGLHLHDLANTTIVQEIVDALNASGIIGIYKTTTYPDGHEAHKRFNRAKHEKDCIKLFPHFLDMKWTADFNGKDHYYDVNHFMPHVNTLMNEKLLDLIGNISERG